MKESEARTKWCPMVRLVKRGGDANASGLPFFDDNRRFGGQNCNCIASECMAWRQIYPSLADLAVGTHMDGEPEGYCGLAGRLS